MAEMARFRGLKDDERWAQQQAALSRASTSPTSVREPVVNTGHTSFREPVVGVGHTASATAPAPQGQPPLRGTAGPVRDTRTFLGAAGGATEAAQTPSIRQAVSQGTYYPDEGGQQQPQQERYTTNQVYRPEGSGLEVEFDSSTTQQQAERFMRQPGRPGTRRRSNLAGKEYGDAGVGRFRSPQGQALERPELNTFTDVMNYKADMATRTLNNESFAKAAEAQNAARRTSAMEEDYGARAAQARASTETAQITNDLRNRLVNAESPIERQRIERQLKLSQGMNPDGSAMSQQDMANLEMDVVGEYTSAMETIPRNERPSVEEWARQNAPGASALLYGESGGGDLTAVGQAFEALSPEQQASVDERFPPDSGATPAQIMEYIQSLNQ